MQFKKSQKYDLGFRKPRGILRADVYLGLHCSLIAIAGRYKCSRHLHELMKNHNFAVGMFVEADIINENKEFWPCPARA